jgi:exopolyphosphatase/guanosine-5'-triphosphate,3'-diphosphate pyrophosphatase
LKLSILLRLAVLLNRSRSNAEIVAIEAAVDGMALSLQFPKDWLASNPLTVTDLERELELLKEVRFRLDYS